MDNLLGVLMVIEVSVVVGIFMIFVTLASGGALFVSMKVSNSISNFRKELVQELDARYVLKVEYESVTALQSQLDEARRAAAKERLNGLENALSRHRDEVEHTLKEILAALKEAQRETRSKLG